MKKKWKKQVEKDKRWKKEKLEKEERQRIKKKIKE